MSHMRLIMDGQWRPEPSRTVETVAVQLRSMLAAGELDLPRPGGGATAQRWAALAGWGRRDLALARLAEGHCDAVAVLAEDGRVTVAGALYGVWAARSGETGARLFSGNGGLLLDGTVRFCSGACSLDRALVVADAPDAVRGGRLLVDVAVAHPRAQPVPDTWQTCAMDAADTHDVRFDELPVGSDAVVGAAGWYTARPGFALGAAGVAAVWWGGAAGLLHRASGHLPPQPDAHQLAHLGELHALLAAADALLERTATALDAAPGADHALRVAEVRCAVERATREVIDRVPRMVGPRPLSRDGELACALADLALYVRQHHAERDHAALGAQVFTNRTIR
jgi:hypothetical protein